MRAPAGSSMSPWLGMERKRKPHACISVPFSKDVPTMHTGTTCSCGWFGLLQDFPAHAPRLGISMAAKEHAYYGSTASMPDTRLIW